MATITTDTFLDDGTARTAGEAWTMNGATLTVRTDTRWHIGSPASMTGSLGSITISTGAGGAFKIDGTKVRWMPFDTGSGTVPAIGTTITQGGVSGYLLGVWADYVSAPTAVGAAMPTTGFLKFREVTGGTFSSGTLTGITANATSSDVTGWIEVVKDQSTNFISSNLGSGFSSEGAWFEIGTTDGNRGQTLQAPTNGGGTASHICAVQVETSPGSGIYEWWASTTTAQGWTTATMATDDRARFVESLGNGQIRFGSDGSNNIGRLPVSGCKVRIPNIIGRVCTTAARATNTIPAIPGSPVFTLTGGGIINLKSLICDWNITTAANSATKIDLIDYATSKTINLDSLKTPSTIRNVSVGGYLASGGGVSLQIIGCQNGLTVENVTMAISSVPSTNGAFYIRNSSNLTLSNIELFHYKARVSNTTFGMFWHNLQNSTVNGIKLIGTNLKFLTCTAVNVSNIDYINVLSGTPTSSNALSAVIIESSANVIIDGFTFGLGNVLDNTSCYNAVFQTVANLGTIKIRNAGTRANPIKCGTTYAPAYVVQLTGTESDIYLQRLYFTRARTGTYGYPAVATKNVTMESVFALNYMSYSYDLSDSKIKGCGLVRNTTALSNYAGTHVFDEFNSDTTGRIIFVFNPPSTASAPYVTLDVTPSQGTGFTGSNAISLDTPGDTAILEMSHFSKGHTGFQNLNADATASGTFTYEYQIDTGSGWNGTWKTASGANLSAETISPSVGFKLKLRVTAVTVTDTNSVTFVRFFTTSTLEAQSDNLYPLDTVPLSFTNLVTGSEVRVYSGTDPATSVEIGGVESTAGSTFSITHDNAGQNGYIAIFAMGYQPIYLPYTFKAVDDSILIQQVVDRNYVNPV